MDGLVSLLLSLLTSWAWHRSEEDQDMSIRDTVPVPRSLAEVDGQASLGMVELRL
jgi:hypothetical protein